MAEDTVRIRAQQVLRRSSIGEFGVYDLELPNGHRTELELLKHPGASAIIPFLDEEHIVLLRQYRFCVGRRIWEVPAGKLDPGEDPESCAHRELTEETGYTAQRLTPLGRILTAPGFTDEIIHLFRADGLVPGAHAREPSELIEMHEVSLERAFELLASGEIIDSKTIVSLYTARSLQPPRR